jgi:holo-[acyl-carrier protein] synthase
MIPLVRTGIDLIEISRLEEFDSPIRQRFLQRVFTEIELEECTHPANGENWASLAGRFAAKEAVAKALGCGIGPVGWREIEVRRGTQGEPVLHLHGEAARIASEQGLVSWSISISHTRTTAAAVAVALGVVKP